MLLTMLARICNEHLIDLSPPHLHDLRDPRVPVVVLPRLRVDEYLVRELYTLPLLPDFVQVSTRWMKMTRSRLEEEGLANPSPLNQKNLTTAPAARPT